MNTIKVKSEEIRGCVLADVFSVAKCGLTVQKYTMEYTTENCNLPENMKNSPSPYDDLTARCPMLGHLVPFTYCKAPGSDLPCRKILDCWHERIDIAAFLDEILSPEEIESITAPSKPKVMQLLELVQKAKSRL